MSISTKLIQAAAGAGGAGPTPFDLASAVYSAGIAAYDITTLGVAYTDRITITGQQTLPHGVFFKPDGLKMFVSGGQGNEINEYDLTGAFNIGSATFNQVFTLQSETYPNLYMRADGLKFYTLGRANDDVQEYDMSTAWDVSTASYVQAFDTTSSGELNAQGLYFDPTGTKMYTCGSYLDKVYQWELSTAWDVSTASFDQDFSISAQQTDPRAITFSNDGLHFYVAGETGYTVDQYTLSTAWDISTASHVDDIVIGSTVDGLYVSPDGGYLIIANDGANTVDLWPFGEVATTGEGNPTGITFKTDGTKMYFIGYQGDDINEFDLSTPWEPSTSTFVQTKSISAQETSPSGLRFKTDGTKMFVIGSSSDQVREYSLSTAWDVSTASYVRGFSVSSQTGTPTGITFGSSGTKMFVSDLNAIYEYTLSTGWDVSTATYVQSLSTTDVPSNYTRDIVLNDDGTKIYVAGYYDFVYEYVMSTAYDLSTATFNTKVGHPFNAVEGIDWSADGDAMFLITDGDNAIFKFTLTEQE